MNETKQELIEQEHSRKRATSFILSFTLWVITIAIGYGFLGLMEDLNRSDESSMVSYIYIWLITIVATIYIGNFYTLARRVAETTHRKHLKDIERNFEQKED